MTIYLRLPTDINMAGSIFNACFDDCLSIESVGSNTVQHNSRNFGHFIQGVLVINIGNNDSNIINRYTFEKPRIWEIECTCDYERFYTGVFLHILQNDFQFFFVTASNCPGDVFFSSNPGYFFGNILASKSRSSKYDKVESFIVCHFFLESCSIRSVTKCQRWLTCPGVKFDFKRLNLT